MERFDVGKAKMFDGCLAWLDSLYESHDSFYINRIYDFNLRLTGSNPQSFANRIAQMIGSSPLHSLVHNQWN